MTKVSFQVFSRWCTENGYNLENWSPSLAIDSKSPPIEISIPQDVPSVAAMVDDLVSLGEASGGYVVWVRDWTIWNERSQEIGLRHLALLTASAIREDAAERGHVYELRSSEWRETIALISVPIMYSWDAHLFFQSGRALVDVIHDGVVSVSLTPSDTQLVATLAPWRSPVKIR
jgi:hypothetical protein